MSSEIKAIIFDYGNVLCEPQAAEDVRKIADALGLPPDTLVERYWRDRGPYDCADLEASDYWNRVAGRTLGAQEVRTAIDLDNRSWTHPRRKTLDWVNRARRNGLQTALLSNLPISLRDALENDCPWLPDFDVRTYSCSVRAAKPDRVIYDECVRALGVPPRHIVFLDDRAENIDGARAAGIHGVLFETAEGAAQDLAVRFGVHVNGYSH